MSKKILGLSILLLIIALTQKSYCTAGTCGDSILTFMLGGFGILFFGGASFCWLANPLLIASWVFRNNNKLSTILSLLSTLIALSFLLFDEIIDNEGGVYRKIIAYQLGYWLWVSSNMVMLIGNLIIRFKKEKS